jgi:hypothetical protein
MRESDVLGSVTMTVQELIAALQGYDPSLPIVTEGCDCCGSVGVVEQHGGDVYLCRSDRGDLDYAFDPPPKRVP